MCNSWLMVVQWWQNVVDMWDPVFNQAGIHNLRNLRSYVTDFNVKRSTCFCSTLCSTMAYISPEQSNVQSSFSLVLILCIAVYLIISHYIMLCSGIDSRYNHFCLLTFSLVCFMSYLHCQTSRSIVTLFSYFCACSFTRCHFLQCLLYYWQLSVQIVYNGAYS